MLHGKMTLLVAAGLTFFIWAAAYGQPPISDSLRIERHMQFLKDSLNLTDSQSVQIHKILEDEQNQATAEREKYRGNPDSMMKAREERRESTDKKIMAVLNKDQQEKYEKLRKEFPRGPFGRGRGRGK